MLDHRHLLVFAHPEEASAFEGVPHLVTGVGKVNAVASLAAAIMEGFGAVVGVPVCSPAYERAVTGREGEPCVLQRVIVLGTAGVVGEGAERLDFDSVYQVSSAVQHDCSLASPELELSGALMLPPERTVKIATGDVFVKDDRQRARIAATGAALVDMEAYAYASLCDKLSLELQMFKVPSDFADSATSDAEWDEIVCHKSVQLRQFWDDHLVVK